MIGSDVWLSAIEMIKRTPLRSFLAALGIMIGVFSVSSMLSLGEMAKYTVFSELEKSGGKRISAYPKYDPVAGKRTTFTTADLAGVSKIGYKDLSYAETVIYIQGTKELETALITGVNHDLSVDKRIKIIAGRGISAAELQSGAPVVVMSSATAQALYGTENVVGRAIAMGRKFPTHTYRDKVTVIGVYQYDSLFQSPGSGTQNFAPLNYYWSKISLERRYDLIVKLIDSDQSLVKIQKEFDDSLSATRKSKNFISEVFDPAVGSYYTLIDTIRLTLALMSILSLIVGGIGIMNIMLVIVSERVREIGIRRAVGATAIDIRQQFTAESIILTVTGGMFGYLLSLLTLAFAVKLFPQYFIRADYSLWIALVSIVTSVVVGLVFGIWPATQAARLPPTAALNHD